MQLVRGLHNLRPQHRGCVATIGNFDGVHRGHQAILGRLRERALELGVPSCVVIFEPQPLELFATDKSPARLTRLREKLRYLAECGVDYVLCVRFDRRFAALTAQTFISDLLVKRLGVQFLAVGDDFRFGASRAGDFLLLQEAGAEYGFDITSTQTFCEGGVRMSGGTMIDDAQGQDEHTLFHAWNAAQTDRRPLLMVGRTPPASWTVAVPDLRSRLAAVPHVAITEPDEALARALIARAFDHAGAGYAADLPDWLLRRIERSYGAIDAVARLLDAAALSSGRKISTALAKEALQAAGFLPIVPPDPSTANRE